MKIKKNRLREIIREVIQEHKVQKIIEATTNPNIKRDYDKGYIFLPTVSAMTLWNNEILGQLSDGAWENSKPRNHWEFWYNLQIKKGSPEVKGGGGESERTRYNLHTLVPIIGDRMVNAARMAKAIGKPLTSDQTIAATFLPEDPNEFKKSGIPNNVQKYIKSLKKVDLEKFYKTDYKKTELNKDLKFIEKAMSTAT